MFITNQIAYNGEIMRVTKDGFIAWEPLFRLFLVYNYKN